MSSAKLVFEKVGDINATYPYLCVYDEHDRLNPFMEIGVTDDKQLQYTIYACTRNVVLNVEDWGLIQDKALEFLPKALADE
ncbi:MAG: hypothetical protein FWF12_12465 [Betaproteobacteria bacterium]|nr:hypothetical protein [Desulfobulbus sp.]MCL2877055.1 hypothetical protein [Betaproteobacteria bacterium]